MKAWIDQEGKRLALAFLRERKTALSKITSGDESARWCVLSLMNKFRQFSDYRYGVHGAEWVVLARGVYLELQTMAECRRRAGRWQLSSLWREIESPPRDFPTARAAMDWYGERVDTWWQREFNYDEKTNTVRGRSR